LQRDGRRAATVTVLDQRGFAVPAALVTVGGRLALSCTGPEVCYRAAVPARRARLAVVVRRPGHAPVAARIDLPAARAPSGLALLAAADRNYRALRSLRRDNVIASGPGQSVHTT